MKAKGIKAFGAVATVAFALIATSAPATYAAGEVFVFQYT